MPAQVEAGDPEGGHLAEPDAGVGEEQDDQPVHLIGAGVVAAVLAGVGRVTTRLSQVVDLITQAEAFGILRVEVGVDPDLVIEHDLLLDPPRGFFAGRTTLPLMPLTGGAQVCLERPRIPKSWGRSARFSYARQCMAFYPEPMLELGSLDVDEVATALSDQTDYDHRWLIDPGTGRVAFWTSDTGIDGEHPIDLDDVELIPIDPLPSWVWHADMVDFAEGVSDDSAGRRLGRAVRGKGAFRRFKDELYEEYPDLVPAWHAFRDTRATCRAVQWLLDQELVDADAAREFLVTHPDPDLP